MSEYRTPEEDRASLDQDRRVNKILDQATRDGASLLVAIALGEPPEVVERWINALWNGVRAGLADRPAPEGFSPTTVNEDRLRAILLLLQPRMDAEARILMDAIDGIGGEVDA